LKEQVYPTFYEMSWTKNTMRIISNIPTPPSEHIPGVTPITNQQPRKHLDPQNHLTLPYPFKNTRFRQRFETMFVI
jgi:hypothetical protein